MGSVLSRFGGEGHALGPGLRVKGVTGSKRNQVSRLLGGQAAYPKACEKSPRWLGQESGHGLTRP